MAGGPLFSDPNQGVQQDRRLVDRAQFVGSAARTAKAVAQELDESFNELLEEKVDEKKSLDLNEKELESSREAAEVFSDKKPVEENLMTDTEVELHNREEALKEGKRRGGWMGPTPIIGLSVAGGPGGLTVGGVSQSEHSRDTGTSATTGMRQRAAAKVDAGLLQALKTSGLAEPLIGLDDPRLSAFPVPLSEDWKRLEIQGGSGYLWQGGLAHQRLELREGFRYLETAAGTMVQTIEGHGTTVESRMETREPPDLNFSL